MNAALACAALADLVGHEVELLAVPRSSHWLVVPVNRSRLKEPFWRVVRDRAPVTDWNSPEAALVAFAAGLAGWARTAAQMPTGDLDTALRERLAAGPAAAAVLAAEFGANGVTRDRLDRAARRVGVARSKAGFDGGWWWSTPKAASEGCEEAPAAVFVAATGATENEVAHGS